MTRVSEDTPRFELSEISLADDLDALARDINACAWDEGNQMSVYDAASLELYLNHQDTLLVTCHRVEATGRTLAGFASGRFQIKPYDGERWLYVDEVDVCADQSRQGVGKATMRCLLEMAEQHDCDEVWLGTETDNTAANALYRSLAPDDVDGVVGYTWELDDE